MVDASAEARRALEEGVWGRNLLKVSPQLARPQKPYPSPMCRRWSHGRPQDIPIFNLAIEGKGGSINTHENAILSYQMLAPRPGSKAK